MCNSIAKGGRRCAAHLEPAFNKAMDMLSASNGILGEVQFAEVLSSISAYASTPKGGMMIYKIIKDRTREKIDLDEWKDFDLAVNMNETKKLDRHEATASRYFAINDTIIALLETAQTRGKEADRKYREREAEYMRLEQAAIESLRTTPLAITAEADYAYERIAKAVASGASLPAPVGTIVFHLSVSEDDFDGIQNHLLGIYESMDAAQKGAVKHIFDQINIIEDMGEITGPWGDSRALGLLEWQKQKIEWFKSRSSDEIMEWASKNINNEISAPGYIWDLHNMVFRLTPMRIESATNSDIKPKEHFKG